MYCVIGIVNIGEYAFRSRQFTTKVSEEIIRIFVL